MKALQRFVQERNEALFSLDKDKIKAYMRKYCASRELFG